MLKYFIQFQNGVWQNSEIIATGLNPINSIDTSYVNNNSVIAYAAKTNSDNSSMDDVEVFYFDGSTTRLTNDITADYSVTFLNDELYWIHENSIVSITGGDNESMSVAVDQIPDSVSTINVSNNTNGQKTITWCQNDGTDTKIYGTYYNELTSKFGTAVPLSKGDGVIRGWDATMMPDGKIQLSYCAAELLEEAVNGRPYGQLNLIQKSADEFNDISVSQMITYDGEVIPNGEITISADVYNNGSKNITQFDVTIIAPDGSIVQNSTLNNNLLIGEIQTLEIPFTLPSEISKTNYQLKITPHGEEDISLNDNRSTFTIGYADLAIKEVKEVRTDNGRRLVITIINQGYASANGTFKVIDGNVNQTVFSNNSISQLQPGSTVEVTYEIDETRLNSSVSEDPLMFKLEIASDEEEPNYVNNNHTTYVYPDYSINLISGVGGTVSGDGVYMYNSIATLTATPNPGYIFAGWYENGQLLDNLAAEYSFDVL